MAPPFSQLVGNRESVPPAKLATHTVVGVALIAIGVSPVGRRRITYRVERLTSSNVPRRQPQLSMIQRRR